MVKLVTLILKGIAMGAANVIPGVSGGTIALITNIYEDLINALKSCDKTALKLLLSGKFKAFSIHINLSFLSALLLGIIISIFSIAKLFEFLLVEYPQQIWAYFFGLVLASVYYVGKIVTQWNWKNIIALLIGTIIAFFISFLNPTPIENTNYLYVFLCGVIGISGMILPGLSGSYILMLMGNYELLMVTSISSLFDFLTAISSGNWNVLSNNAELAQHLTFCLLFLAGSIIGMVAFSHLISWVFKKYHNATLAILTGFVFGSLSIIWPWKKEVFDPSLTDRAGEPLLIGYSRFFPENWSLNEIITVACILVGVLSIVLIETLSKKNNI